MNMNNYVCFLVLSVVISSFSQILLKKSAKEEHGSFLKEYLNPYVIIGYGMMVMATLLTIMAYRKIEYRNGPVIESIGYVLIMFLGYIFYREPITKKKVIGNLLVLLGIAVFYM